MLAIACSAPRTDPSAPVDRLISDTFRRKTRKEGRAKSVFEDADEMSAL